jgi:uncharacterized protein
VPTRDGAPLGAPIWIDLTSSDTARAQDFYGTVFGWTFSSAGPDYGGYIDAAGNAAGGSSCVAPMQIPGRGAMAVGMDPSGAAYGLWQPIGHHGFEIVGEAGASVWHQLTTRDYGAALGFYRDVLGWDTRVESDSPEFRYTTAVFDGEQQLGVMDGAKLLPDGVPPHWVFFLGAGDVDKTLEVITDDGRRSNRRGVQPVVAAGLSHSSSLRGWTRWPLPRVSSNSR